MDAIAFHIELPSMEHARHVFRCARRRPLLKRPGGAVLNHVSPMWTDIKECSNLVICPPDHHHWLTGYGHRPEGIRLGKFRLMANWHPHLTENLSNLLFENIPVRINPAVDIFSRGNFSRNFFPLLGVSSWHSDHSFAISPAVIGIRPVLEMFADLFVGSSSAIKGLKI